MFSFFFVLSHGNDRLVVRSGFQISYISSPVRVFHIISVTVMISVRMSSTRVLLLAIFQFRLSQFLRTRRHPSFVDLMGNRRIFLSLSRLANFSIRRSRIHRRFRARLFPFAVDPRTTVNRRTIVARHFHFRSSFFTLIQRTFSLRIMLRSSPARSSFKRLIVHIPR